MFKNSYDIHIPLKKFEIKRKDFLSPWITKVLKKSSKRKQKLYVKFLKTKSFKAEKRYKSYKNLFEKLKYLSMKSYSSSQHLKHQNNARKTWHIMKEK